MFIVAEKGNHYLVLILLIIFFGLDAILTNKNRNNNAINRLLYYKLYSLILLTFFIAYYFVEINNHSQHSKAMGVVSSILLCGVMYLFMMESVIRVKESLCPKQEERQDITNITVE